MRAIPVIGRKALLECIMCGKMDTGDCTHVEYMYEPYYHDNIEYDNYEPRTQRTAACEDYEEEE
jgi:hypothetical protein